MKICCDERVIEFRSWESNIFPANLNSVKSGRPNLVTTTKFTPLTWLPKSLFHQFQRIANAYFLFVAIVVLYLDVAHSPAPKKPVSKIVPFACVLLWTALKDLFEDMRRWRDDNTENSKTCHRFDRANRTFEQLAWRDVQCGDIIFVEGDSAFPADLLLLQAAGGHEAFISTINLDGETNLKQRNSPALCGRRMSDPGGHTAINARTGKVSVISTNSADAGGGNTPMRPHDCWSGPVTSCSSCSFYTPSSRSSKKVDSETLLEEHNNASKYLNCLLNRDLTIRMSQPEPGLTDVRGTLTMVDGTASLGETCFMPRGCVLRNTVWSLGVAIYVGDDTKTRMNSVKSSMKVSNMQYYLNKCVWGLLLTIITIDCVLASVATIAYDSKDGWFVRFLQYCVVLYHVIPISLYVAFEFLKLCLGLFINIDPMMEDPVTKEKALARTADLVEEMGQVDFIFSDKTGTLTANEMVFARCSVAGTDMGDYRTAPDLSGLTNAQRILSAPSDPLHADLDLFFLCLATCHSCQVESAKVGGDDDELMYSGMSPDEVALVQAAHDVGVVFRHRGRDMATAATEAVITGPGGRAPRTFTVLHELEFNSDRKRMSVICKHNTEIWCITKGADNIMSGLLDRPLGDSSQEHLASFSKQGLRTLVIAVKKVDPQHYEKWQRDYAAAQNTVDSTRNHRIAEVAACMETSLHFVGITAVEDRLQDEVPESIATLKAAGIRVWVLTGDKTETAVHIARSCRLFTETTKLVYATNGSSTQDTLDQLRSARTQLQGSGNGGLVLDGRTVAFALGDSECEDLIFELGLASKSCICCRLSPMQKRMLVELVRRKKPDGITLAIGDGANDVPMIEGAHVGIGIRGKEGAQAVQVSDVAISQFRFLVPLLLCHGRRAYMRIAYFLCYYLYKNIALAMADVIWAVQGEFNGTIAYPEYLSMLFNVLFNSWHIIVVLLLDKAVSNEVALSHPSLYKAGIQRVFFNPHVFLTWIFYAIYHGTVSWVIPNAWFGGTAYTVDEPSSFWLGSATSLTCLVLIVDIRFLLMANKPLSLHALVPTAVAILSYFMCLFVLGETRLGITFQESLEGIPSQMLTSSKSLGALVCTVVAALVVDCTEIVLRHYSFPTELDKVRKQAAKLTTTTGSSTEEFGKQLSSVMGVKEETLTEMT